MEAVRIQTRSVARAAVVTLVVLAGAALLLFVLREAHTTLRWVVTAIFLALALDPAVGLVQRAKVQDHGLPRWISILIVFVALGVFMYFLVLHVIPPIVREVEALGKHLPGYVKDFENWANNSEQFRELNDKYDLTQTLSSETSKLPSTLGAAAGEVEVLTVKLIAELFAAITILAMTFFLLLDGRRHADAVLRRLPPQGAERTRRVVYRIADIVRAYVSVNRLLAAAAGVFTWLVLELLGVELAVPLGVLVAFMDLVPLIGFTVGGFLVAIICMVTSLWAGVVWLVLFLVYQQLQDRVIQPLMYANAVRVPPFVGIVAVLVGASVAGILGALLAIPVAASLGVVLDEFVKAREESDEEPAGSGAPEPAA